MTKNRNTKKSKRNLSKGRWKKGTSGNPSGRPAGSRNRSTLILEQLLDGQAETIIAKAMELAKEGNTHALRLCMDRILPARKERSVTLELRPITRATDISEQLQCVTAAIAEGRITPAEGESITNILTSHVRIFETVELERRIEELENHENEVLDYRNDMSDFVSSHSEPGGWSDHEASSDEKPGKAA
ncbi:MAG: DUF5681 domain-containing protein [Bryobacteraceae bacterium]|jgi:hypothetical protein